MTDREIRTAEDAESIREDIEAVYDGWFQDASRIDWVDFLDRLEARGYDLGGELLSPAITRIKSIVRQIKKEEE